VVPENITPEEAATMPIPITTAVQAFYLALRLPEPVQPTPGSDSPWILIWSGVSPYIDYGLTSKCS
jgi:NADPH:quinone reductase-like Zn-dependent oxidoreductase